jgi:photosystem II stability/assembly factor-like uncharacterized protein
MRPVIAVDLSQKPPYVNALDLALSDGTIVATQDGGRHWKATFRP